MPPRAIPNLTKRRVLVSGLSLLPLLPRIGFATGTSLRIDHEESHQVVEGFGTSINTWQEDVVAGYQREDWARFYAETLGASMLRIELWPGVAPTPRERWQDITWRDFLIQGHGPRPEVTVGLAKRLLSLTRGSLRIIATAWSPPAWMKINGSLGNGHSKRKNFALNLDSPVELGTWRTPENHAEGQERFEYVARNKLRRDRYQHFAKYLVEWTRFLELQGIPLYALSPANELRFSHWFESCVYTPAEYAELLSVVAWMFANQRAVPLPLFGPEHMTADANGNQLYLDAVMRNDAAKQALAAFASHGYIDGYRADLRRDSASTLRKVIAQSGKKTWLTEGGFGKHEWPAPLHQIGASFLFALRDGDVSLISAWQALTRYPPDVTGLMSIRGPTKKTFVAMQFWRFIRPGMVRIGAKISGGPDTVAFMDIQTNTTVVVLLNRTSSPTLISLDLVSRRDSQIEALFLTDESHDCSRIEGKHDLRSVSIPSASVVTILIRSGSR